MQTTVTVYATHSEVFSWLNNQAERHILYFALVIPSPIYRLVPISECRQIPTHPAFVEACSVWIDLHPLIHDCRGQAECCDKNKDRLGLELPKTTEYGIGDWILGSLSEDDVHLRVWRSIIRYFRKKTTSGMWVLNPTTGARAFYKHLRYSDEIAKLHQTGLHLLPTAGSNRVLIEEPVKHDL